MKFEPWAHGEAVRADDGKTIVGTLALRADSGLRLLEAVPVHDGQFLVCTFEVLEEGKD